MLLASKILQLLYLLRNLRQLTYESTQLGDLYMLHPVAYVICEATTGLDCGGISLPSTEPLPDSTE